MKVFNGVVISVKMNNTGIVEVTRRTPHPMYGKLIKRSKKYKVDTLGQELTIGQAVKIVETRPMSKDKYFKVMENKKTAGKVSSAPRATVSTPAKPEKVSPAKKMKTSKTVKPTAAKAKVDKKETK